MKLRDVAEALSASTLPGDAEIEIVEHVSSVEEPFDGGKVIRVTRTVEVHEVAVDSNLEVTRTVFDEEKPTPAKTISMPMPSVKIN